MVTEIYCEKQFSILTECKSLIPMGSSELSQKWYNDNDKLRARIKLQLYCLLILYGDTCNDGWNDS